MAILLRMPEVAANATRATLQAWTRSEGDPVQIGDCLAEIETDKAMVELNADAAGFMGRQLIRPGQEVEVGAPIGVLVVNGETSVDIDALIASAAPVSTASALEEPRATPSKEQPAIVDNGRVFASPLARRLAVQNSLDLATLSGSGPNGRVVKRDIERALVTRVSTDASVNRSAPTVAPGTPSQPAIHAGHASSFLETPHSNMRQTIARRLSESKASIPHFYLTCDCRMDRLLALRTEINAGASRKISINDFIVRAVAVALREVPEANVSWTDTAMRQYQKADIAVAVSTDSGLITPIVRAADTKSLSVISTEIAELALRARASRLRPDEYQGGSFSVSNLGMYGIDEFAAIINPPQAAILAVGTTRAAAVVENSAVTVASVMRCTLSVDHRAIDGAVAARWLTAFRMLVENPLSMLI